MKRYFGFLTCLAIGSMVGSTAVAHPGHGAGGSGDLTEQIIHHATEPIHLVSIVFSVLVSGALALAITSVLSYMGKNAPFSDGEIPQSSR